MMTNCEIKNLTRRLVSIRGNSSQTYHLPPKFSIELPEVEVRENQMVKKLVARGLLAVQKLEKIAPGEKGEEGAVREEHKPKDDGKRKKSKSSK